MHGDPGNARLDDAAVETAAEVAWLDRRTVSGGEDQAGFDQGGPPGRSRRQPGADAAAPAGAPAPAAPSAGRLARK